MRSITDPKKENGSHSPYRDILVSSLSKEKSSSIPPEMLDQMQAIIDQGNIMEKRDDLKKYLSVLVDEYGLDTSKLAEGITDQKAKEKDMGYLRRQAERAKIGAGLAALGYQIGGMLNVGDPVKGDPKKKSTGYAALDARLARLAEQAQSDTSNYTMSQRDRLQRQIMAESSGNPKAVSDAGARGLLQIMPATQKDLEDRGLIPRGLDPFNPDDSRRMRNAKINALSELSWIKEPPKKIPEVNRLARIYASYNAGEGRIKSALEAAKADGVDIYGDPRAWFDYIPEETRGYLNKILFD